MGFKKYYTKTKATLTSPKAKRNWKSTKAGAIKVAKYIQRVDSNIDDTFSIPKKYPDNTLSNRNKNVNLVKRAKRKPAKVRIPKGYKLVKL